jgi:hypothetical protein
VEDTQKTLEQIELEAAQVRLSEARQAVALRERMLLDKAAADIAAHRAAEEKKLNDQRLEVERINRMHAERKAKQAEAELREKQLKDAEERRLEAEFNARQEEVRKRAEHEEFLRRVADATFALEQEEKRLAAELVRSTPVARDDNTTHCAEVPEGDVDSDTQGRQRLFLRTLGVQSKLQSAQTQSETPNGVPKEFLVSDGRIDPRVFAQRFGIDRRGNFFVSPSTGELILNGYRWHLADSTNPRIWQHGTEIYVALDVNGYVLRKVGTSDSVRVTPVDVIVGITFDPLPSDSESVDDENIVSDNTPTVSLSR